MNFIGHALVASWERDASAFALGAMLPDLVGIIGARLGSIPDEVLSAGVAHHHRVDGIFHGCPPFLELQAVAREALPGFSRGAARGVAHVAVELLLDGEISRQPRARAAFEGALKEAGRLSAGRDLGLDVVSALRFRWMLARFSQVDLPAEYRRVDFVAARVVGALAGRPRLSLDAREASQLPAALELVQRAVAARAQEVLASVRLGLE